MIDTESTILSKVIFHKVGNIAREEENQFSDNLFDLSDEIRETLQSFFLTFFVRISQE